MKQPILAHLSEDRQRTQTLLDHLHGTAQLAAGFAAPFGAAAVAEQTALAHDLGKSSDAFQRRLLEDGPRVDHSTAGAWELYRLSRGALLLPAAAIAGHHGGLPDIGSGGDLPEDGTLTGRLKRARDGVLPPYDGWQDLGLDLRSAPLPSFCGRGNSFADAFFARMLYSCLVDADYLDTETFMNGAPAERGSAVTLTELQDRLLSAIGDWLENKDDSTLNGRRSAILRQCLQAAEDPAPLRTLTVPTGGGKTAASLAYALRHGAVFGKRRIIYVIPYTSIIEQTADNFRDWLGEEAVLEHHHGADYTVEEGQETDPATVRKALATENWDAPVIVTTAVQFFESLFAARSSRCRKLHNLADSVIVFDEAQMLPLPYLRPCVAAIAQLVAHYGVTAVLCTATQPALDSLFRELSPGLAPREIVPGTQALFDAFRRVAFRQLGVQSPAELAARMGEQPQALCITATRKEAQAIYRLLPPEGRFHLSTLMPPVRRREVLAHVCQRLRDHLPCRLVSTSLIECGVDVDFPAVYRAEAGLDSVLQAAGRCNREGKRCPEESVVSIYRPEGGLPPLFRPQAEAFASVAERFPDFAASEAVTAYFQLLRTRLGPAAQDRQGILDAFAHGTEGRLLPFRTVAERFHLIDTSTRTVYLPIDEASRSLLRQLEKRERSRSLFRKLGIYGVSLYPGHFEALLRTGAIRALDQDAAILDDLRLYDPDTGISLEADEGRALFC